MANFAFTYVRYKILAMVILSFVFVIIAFSRDDWMREEFSMKMGPIKKIIKENTGSILNMTSVGIVPKSSSSSDVYLNMIQDDASIDLMMHFGLKKILFENHYQASWESFPACCTSYLLVFQ